MSSSESDDGNDKSSIDIYNKLSEIIDDQVEFVVEKSKMRRKNNNKVEEDPAVDCMRLLRESDEPVKFLDAPDEPENRKKVAIKRRITEPEVDEAAKIQASAVDEKLIESEVKNWTSKVKPTTDYKVIKGVGYIRDIPNEFTKLRNKNSWSENKIKNANYFNKSLESLIER